MPSTGIRFAFGVIDQIVPFVPRPRTDHTASGLRHPWMSIRYGVVAANMIAVRVSASRSKGSPLSCTVLSWEGGPDGTNLTPEHAPADRATS
jgi:hypothetical protein